MNIRNMRRIDYWIGVPLCFLLSLWEFFFRKIFSFRERQPRKILFVELSEMGSAILSYSTLYQARKQFQDAEPFFLIFESNVGSLELLNLFPPKNILTIKDKNFFEFALTAFAALRRIRSLKIDTVIDMELFSRFSAIFSYLTGASNRVAFHQYTAEGLFRGGFMTHKVMYNPHQHISLNFMSLLFSLKAPRGEVPLLKENLTKELVPLPLCPVSSEEKSYALELLRRENPSVTSQSPLIIINAYPGKLIPIRGWPINHYIDLIKRLLNLNPELNVVLIGLSTATNYNGEIVSRVVNKRCIDLSGKTDSPKDLVSLLSLAKLLISNDGGPVHFASLIDLHSVVLFGPETPALYSPIGSANTVLYSSFSCSPCISAFNHRNTPCSDNKCLQAISVEQVYSAVISAYQNVSKFDLKSKT